MENNNLLALVETNEIAQFPASLQYIVDNDPEDLFIPLEQLNAVLTIQARHTLKAVAGWLRTQEAEARAEANKHPGFGFHRERLAYSIAARKLEALAAGNQQPNEGGK